MEVAARTANGSWKKAARVEFEDEQALQKLLYDSPELLSGDEGQSVVFVREVGLPGSGNTDLIGIDRDGAILLVETKLARNQEVRRKVVGQILEYAAHLWGMSYEALDRLLQARPPHKRIIDLLIDKFSDIDVDELRAAVQRNLDEGTFQLVVAVDEMNAELQKIIDYVAVRGDGLRLTALEVKVHKWDEQELLVLERHGATSESTITPGFRPMITEAQMLANCPDENSRTCLAYLLRRWRERGNEVSMGTQAASFRSDVAGRDIPVFWAYANGIQSAFGKHLIDRGAPIDLIDSYRTAVSKIKGYDTKKVLNRSQPITKWAALTEESIEAFLRETDRFLKDWASSTSTFKSRCEE